MLLKAGDIPSVTLIAVCIVAMLFSHLPLQRKAGWSLQTILLFPFWFLNLFFLLLFFIHLYFNSSHNESPFLSVKLQELGWNHVELVKAIVSNVCFKITFTD
jgi:hypothetical protein